MLQYTWTRDSALTISTLLPYFLDNTTGLPGAPTGDGILLEPLIRSYVTAQQALQVQPNPSGAFWTGGIGEPKFEVSGKPFIGDWGRPQR
jgi:glucoamylase